MEISEGCPSLRCHAETFTGIEPSGKTVLLEALPHPDGTYKVRGEGQRPLVIRLTVTQQFGQQGRLYRNHLTVCETYKREKKR